MQSKHDRELVEVWFKKYGEYLFRNAYIFFNRDRETAEEVLQETFRILSGMKSLDQVEFPRAKLKAIMHNVIGNLLARRKRDEELLEKLRRTASPNEDLIAEDGADPMLEYRGLIPERDMRLVLLIAVEHRTYQEAAEIMGISAEACRKRYDRSIRKLRDKLMCYEI